MDLIICLLIAIVVAGAFMGVVRAVFAASPSLVPYGGIVYALIVLLVVLAVIQFCFGYRIGNFPRHG